MKIDIVDLMDFYWDDSLVLDAQDEMLKQGGAKLVLNWETSPPEESFIAGGCGHTAGSSGRHVVRDASDL